MSSNTPITIDQPENSNSNGLHLINFQLPTSESLQPRKNFTIEEDIRLCESFISIAFYPRPDDEQKGGTFWSRIADHYKNSNVNNAIERNARALTNRWQLINKGVSKYVRILAKVEQENPSGSLDYTNKFRAKTIYRTQMKTNFTLDHCHQVLAREKKWIDAVMKSVEKKRAKNSKTGANSVATTTTTTTTTTAAATATATATADVDVAVANTLEEADSGSDISLSPPTGRTQQMVTNEPKKRSFQEMMQTFSARIDETTTLEVNDTSDLTNKVAKDQAAAQLLLVKEQIRVAEAERLVAEERILLTKAQRLIAEAQFIAIDANEIKDPTKRQWMLNMQNKIMEKGSGDSRNNVDSN